MGIHLERRSDGAKVVLIQVEQQKHEEVVLCSGCSSSYFLVLGANWTTRGRGQELDLWGMDMCAGIRKDDLKNITGWVLTLLDKEQMMVYNIQLK